MSDYYAFLTDLEIEEKIEELSENQKTNFEIALCLGSDRRRALFVASSYFIEKTK